MVTFEPFVHVACGIMTVPFWTCGLQFACALQANFCARTKGSF